MISSKVLHSQSLAPVNSEGLRPVQPNEFLPPVSRWTTLGSLAMLIIFGGSITLAAVLNYPTRVKAPAVIRPVGELRVVQAPITGKIIRIDVELHQVVEQGQAIAYLDTSLLQTQKQQLQTDIQHTQQQIHEVNAQIQALHTQIVAETQVIQRIIATAEGELRLNQQRHQERQATTQAEVREAEATVRQAQEELARYQSLADTGAVSQSQISEKMAILEVALARLQRSQAALNPDTEIEISMEKVAQERAKGESTLATLNREQNDLRQQAIELQNQLNRDNQELQQVNTQLDQTIVRAPIAGIIQQLNLRNPDQLMQQGDLIAQIIPERAPFVIKAYVSTEDIGQVKIGQSVTMKVSSCPYPDYGTLNGQITTVSPDRVTGSSPTLDAAAPNSPDSLEHFYEITVQTSAQSISTNDYTCSLQAGMNGDVDIMVREETALVFLLRKMKLLTGL